MFDKEAIQELATAHAVNAANEALGVVEGVVALPGDFARHDLEQFMGTRRRARGTMRTEVLRDFTAYVAQHAEEGATVFVDTAKMEARGVLNLGGPDSPGHADNLAVFAPPKTSAYRAMCAATAGPLSQLKAAEFLEDIGSQASMVFVSPEGEDLPATRAIAAVRNITIESARKVESAEKSLGATRSAFESIQASSVETLPTRISLSFAPYLGLTQRVFTLRLGVLTGDKPQVVLRVINAEQHAEDMAAELAQVVRGALDAVPVVVGTYQAAA